MTTHPIDTVYVDNAEVAKGDVRAFEKARNRVRADDANWVRSRDLSDTFGVDVSGHHFDFASGDSTTADDGVSCIVDAVGNRFIIVDARETISILIDGNNAVIQTGIKVDIPFPEACKIVGWTLLADQSGSIVIDLWKDSYANYPPTVADTITASAKPTISSATKNQSTTLTGWTTSIAAGDTIRVKVDSITSLTRATLTLTVIKT